jgi:hypothetical protein
LKKIWTVQIVVTTHDTHKAGQIIHFGDFPLGDFHVSHLKVPKAKDFQSRTNLDIRGDTWKQIFHFGDFPLGDFHASHLKLPKPRLRRESGPFIHHDTWRQIIHFRDFPLGDVSCFTFKTPEARKS